MLLKAKNNMYSGIIADKERLRLPALAACMALTDVALVAASLPDATKRTSHHDFEEGIHN
jgi:hypothetical protein